MPNQHLTLEERFWIKVKKQRGCWPWIAHVDAGGYGRLNVGGSSRMAHRFSYELLVQKIPAGKFIDHLCRNRKCVNPAHMEVVTFEENILRGVNPAAMNKRKRSCLRGHPLRGENVYVGPSGRRTCKTCRKISDAKRRPR
jgi:hypothetical protein